MVKKRTGYAIFRLQTKQVNDQQEEFVQMAEKKSKPKTKRLSKGQRTHIRRLKQAATKEGTVYKPVN
ncbi:MAG: hypothetical protein IH586_04070 [Anaerolineaceae bacterium]|nr:hypothetical protein [Anaerolineaceae bacterium]